MIGTNSIFVALFVWEIEANIGKLPSQKFQKQPPLTMYKKIDFGGSGIQSKMEEEEEKGEEEEEEEEEEQKTEGRRRDLDKKQKKIKILYKTVRTKKKGIYSAAQIKWDDLLTPP